VLDPVAVRSALAPVQKVEARIPFTIAVDDRKLTCDFAPKAVRKAFAVITEHGAENMAVFLQGKLGKGDVILEAGLVAAPKVRQKEAA
jgi:hypothetical protein